MWVRGARHIIGRGTLRVWAGLVAAASCSASPDAAPTTPTPPQPPAPPVPLTIQCTRSGASCPAITIGGDPVASTPTFRGYADGAVVRDPRVTDRLWLTYTYLEGRPATSSTGQLVGVPHTATHLAQSTDGGTTWSYVARIWNAGLAPDPEGMGPSSYLGSETPSLAAAMEGQTVRWYSARLQYFLEPASAYLPRYATSWVIRVATATGDSPAVLAAAPEAVLGVASTANAYGPTARLSSLAPSLAACGIWNNPATTVEGGRLFVLTECLEFDGGQVSDTRSRVVVFSTVPTGAPATWVWRFDGVIADRALAVELGAARLVSANVSRTEDGRRMLLLSVHAGGVGLVNQGCVGVELASLAPPSLVRTNGQLHILARVTNQADPNWYTGSCGHEAGSGTGIIAAAATNSAGLQSELRATRLRP